MINRLNHKINKPNLGEFIGFVCHKFSYNINNDNNVYKILTDIDVDYFDRLNEKKRYIRRSQRFV